MATRKLEIGLDERVVEQLERMGAREGLAAGEFLARVIEARAADLAPAAGKRWMPRERWDALVRGEDCPMCAGLARGDEVDSLGYTVADLAITRLRLAANQSVRGYCVLICHRHVREAYHLDPAEARLFFDDLMRAARAMEEVFEPIKMNLELLGNGLPHLHCHLKPRYYGDSAPGAPIWQDRARHALEAAEYADRVARLRAALARQGATWGQEASDVVP
jgi:diadenosine tetraphosphate (Ap4A) HIT family hydrolase